MIAGQAGLHQRVRRGCEDRWQGVEAVTPEVWGTAGPRGRLPGVGSHETGRLLFQTCGSLQTGTHPLESQSVGPPGGQRLLWPLPLGRGF